MVDDPSLRAAYAIGSPPDHVADATWDRLACGELTPAERERAVEHIVRCPDCMLLYQTLGRFHEGARAIDAQAPVAGPSLDTSPPLRAPRGLVGGLLLTMAAALAWVALGPLGLFTTGFGKGVPASPSAPGDVLRSRASAAPVPLAPIGESGSRVAQFRWRGVPTARAYRVRVFDADGELIWASGDVTATELAWPQAFVARPGRYYWQVVAFVPSAERERASDLKTFDLKP